MRWLRISLVFLGSALIVASLGDCTGDPPATILENGADAEATCSTVSGATCWTGAASARSVGACHDGVLRCEDAGTVCVGQVTPSTETCNEVDDDCNGTIDDGFDKLSDDDHCGSCANACDGGDHCADGGCIHATEAECNDTLDNDGDGKTDCADEDCAGKACGRGCICTAFRAKETDCADGVDNDGDTKVDCADGDCKGQPCTKGQGNCGTNGLCQ